MQSDRKQICSRGCMSANYGEACKERFSSLRSASFEVVYSPTSAPHIYFQIFLYFYYLTCNIIRTIFLYTEWGCPGFDGNAKSCTASRTEGSLN